MNCCLRRREEGKAGYSCREGFRRCPLIGANRHPTDGPNIPLLNRLGHQFDAARVELSKHPNTAAPTNPANVKKALANSEPSTHGTNRSSRNSHRMSVVGGKAEVICSRGVFPSLTQVGSRAPHLL